jgi:type II secretory pathway pseudopilin PulG
MKTPSFPNRRRSQSGFSLVEALISLTVVASVLGMAMSTYMVGIRTMYKDQQRLATNAALRSFMAQISKETLDASYFYLFDYYTRLDGSVNLSTDPAVPDQNEDYDDDDYDKWVAHGDCLVLVTTTNVPDTPKIRQVRVYYRRTTTQAQRNADAPLRYYETQDWGVNGTDSSLATILNGINLSSATSGANYDSTGLAYNPSATDFSGSKLLTLRTRGRTMPAPEEGDTHTLGDLYPIFSSESASASATDGFISINVEFLNGSGTVNLLTSSSFNYTISPRR